MIDLMIYESGNGGELSLLNGDIQMTDSLSNQPYLAHFGGNVEAITTGNEEPGDERNDWFGNIFISDPKSQMNSTLEKALNENAISSIGRININKSAKNDLEFLSEIATIDNEILVTVDKISIKDKINKSISSFQWSATKSELIQEITI